MNKHTFAQPARKNYRDIPGQYDRMGQVTPFAPAGFAPAGFAPGFAGGMVPAGFSAGNENPFGLNACGATACCPVPQPTRAYERVVGLPRVCIGGCDSESIDTSVCGPFTMTGLYIAPKVAHFLSITRLQVGCNNILVNCDPIPAELFSCCEVDENIITAPTVDANSPICLEVENESQREIAFRGAIKGLLCVSCF